MNNPPTTTLPSPSASTRHTESSSAPPRPPDVPAGPLHDHGGPSNVAWLVVGSVVAIAVLAWTTFQVVDLLAHGRRTETVTITEPVDVVDVSASSGFVHVVATERDTITLTASISDGLRETSTSQRVVDGRLVVRSSCPAFGGVWCSTDYTLEVPTGTAVRVRADNGQVRVSGATGDVDAASDNGSVVIDDARAESVSARSDNGRVELRFSSAPMSVTALSDNGSVEIILPDTAVDYRVDASSDNGDVDAAVRTDPASDRVITARSDNGRVTVRYGS
jgi:Putative adhesin